MSALALELSELWDTFANFRMHDICVKTLCWNIWAKRAIHSQKMRCKSSCATAAWAEVLDHTIGGGDPEPWGWDHICPRFQVSISPQGMV